MTLCPVSHWFLTLIRSFLTVRRNRKRTLLQWLVQGTYRYRMFFLFFGLIKMFYPICNDFFFIIQEGRAAEFRVKRWCLSLQDEGEPEQNPGQRGRRWTPFLACEIRYLFQWFSTLLYLKCCESISKYIEFGSGSWNLPQYGIGSILFTQLNYQFWKLIQLPIF